MPNISIPTAPPRLQELPEPLRGLEDLVYNLRWTWRKETQQLFEQIDPLGWSQNVSPVRMIREKRKWDDLEGNEDFIREIEREQENLSQYLSGFHGARLAHLNGNLPKPVAYFCAEYALHTSMNQYAGGLGILAGDHCKEASDLGLPLVGVGLFYGRGFFHQMVDWSGRQEALYPEYSPENLPLRRIIHPTTSEALFVVLELPGRDVSVAAWLFQIGRTPLLLLDTDVSTNFPEDRKITSQLYTNHREMRLYQEFVLGVGGVRLLSALGIEASCFHLNEGHSALLLLERMRALLVAGIGYREATKEVKASSVLTIHTPVPEGNERFGSDLVKMVLGELLEDSLLTPKTVLKDGLGKDEDPDVFDMTAYALRHTALANGVSLLHGRTADGTWRGVTGKPVIGITNGVHLPTWLGPEIRVLLERHGASFDPVTDLEVGDAVRPDWIPALSLEANELWEAHQLQKRTLIRWAQKRLFEEHARHGDGPSQLARFEHILDPDAFLIGFARRFATYKRAALLFSDLKRALKLFGRSDRKIQILFAGKSHPSDRSGQALIEQVFNLSQSPSFLGKVFLLEDYDMEAGALLVQGVDLWLNNPRRPLEASGTSGMKAAANGVPNLSILDGWWDEGYNAVTKNGWAIGGTSEAKDLKSQDRRDAKALYRVLDSEVIPCFFERDGTGVPHRWVDIMRRSIAGSLFSFSTVRMLRDYQNEMYVPVSGLETGSDVELRDTQY